MIESLIIQSKLQLKIFSVTNVYLSGLKCRYKLAFSGSLLCIYVCAEKSMYQNTDDRR